MLGVKEGSCIAFLPILNPPRRNVVKQDQHPNTIEVPGAHQALLKGLSQA